MRSLVVFVVIFKESKKSNIFKESKKEGKKEIKKDDIFDVF